MKQFTIPEGMRDLIPEECRIRTKLRNDIEARLDSWGYEEVITPTVEFYKTYEAGFDNINVDVMHGLPGQSAAAYLDTLARVCARPDVRHVSAYALILEEGTPLFERVRAGRAALPDEDAVADMQDAGMAYLAAHGFTRYEISNFARAGFACRHNLNYWNNGEYLGFGAAAHGAQAPPRGAAHGRHAGGRGVHRRAGRLPRAL